jgi:hypothetical protein
MALPTGFPPASFRLEDGCLMCSATATILKMVSAAGFAPAVTRFQAGHVAATSRAGRPGVLGAQRGLRFMGSAGPAHLEPVSRGEIRKLADPKGVAPLVAVRKHPSRRQRVALLIELRVRNGGKCW